jgi:hypothetical protein
MTPLLVALSLGGTPNPVTVPFIGRVTDLSWGSPFIMGLFAAAALFLVAFIAVEARAKEAIIPLDLFKNRIFTVSAISVLLAGVGMFGAVLYIPLFIQAVQGDSATSSGNAITPMTMAIVISSIISGQIISRTGKYRIMGIAGTAIVTLGMFLLYTMNMETERLTTIFYMVIMGLGLGITFPLYTLVVQNAFPIQRVGVVTAAVQFFRSIGGTIGVAILGSVVNNQFHDRFPAEMAQQVNALPPEAAARVPVDQLVAGMSNMSTQGLVGSEGAARLSDQLVNQFHVPAQFAGQLVNLITEAMKPALFAGIQEAFLIGTVLFALATVTTAFLKELPLRKSNRGGPGGWGDVPGGSGPDGRRPDGRVGKEMAAEGLPGASNIPADDEPILVRK